MCVFPFYDITQDAAKKYGVYTIIACVYESIAFNEKWAYLDSQLVELLGKILTRKEASKWR